MVLQEGVVRTAVAATKWEMLRVPSTKVLGPIAR